MCVCVCVNVRTIVPRLKYLSQYNGLLCWPVHLVDSVSVGGGGCGGGGVLAGDDMSFTTSCLRASGIIRKQLVQLDTAMHPASSLHPPHCSSHHQQQPVDAAATSAPLRYAVDTRNDPPGGADLPKISYDKKAASTRLPSVRFRSWSRFLTVSLQVTWVINPTVGCHYFPPGPAVTPATLKRAATSFAAWWTEARWVWTVCLRLLPDSVAAAIWTQALLRLSPAR